VVRSATCGICHEPTEIGLSMVLYAHKFDCDFSSLSIVPNNHRLLQLKRNKKLSYCCDSRSYCMQYLNAIYCDRNLTSELRKIRSLSVRWANNCCGSASAIRSPHTAPSRQAERNAINELSLPWRCRVSLLTNEPCLFDSYASCSVSPSFIYGVSLVFLWCILWLNDTSYSKSVWRDK